MQSSPSQGPASGYAERIRSVFLTSMARESALPLWKRLRQAIAKIPSRRLIKHQAREAREITQEQLAAALAITQPTISRWLNGDDGCANWENMVAAVTCVQVEARVKEIEFSAADADKILPLDAITMRDVDQRLRDGLKAALCHVRIKELGERRSDLPSDETIHGLRELFRRSNGWLQAKTHVGEERQNALCKAAQQIAKALDHKLGIRTKYRTVVDFQQLEREWAAAWHLCSAGLALIVASKDGNYSSSIVDVSDRT